jgi:hypothetical protein
MRRCPYCGRDNAEGAVYCTQCGTDIRFQEDQVRKLNARANASKLWRTLTSGQKGIIVTAAALLFCTAAVILPKFLHKPKLAEGEVIQVANAALVARGIYPSDYKAPRAQFEWRERDRTWTVFYDLRTPTPWEPRVPAPKTALGAPRHFMVAVDDRTRRTKLSLPSQIGGSQDLPSPSGTRFLWKYTQQVEQASPPSSNSVIKE